MAVTSSGDRADTCEREEATEGYQFSLPGVRGDGEALGPERPEKGLLHET